jgi:hypothetical protein
MASHPIARDVSTVMPTQGKGIAKNVFKACATHAPAIATNADARML